MHIFLYISLGSFHIRENLVQRKYLYLYLSCDDSQDSGEREGTIFYSTLPLRPTHEHSDIIPFYHFHPLTNIFAYMMQCPTVSMGKPRYNILPHCTCKIQCMKLQTCCTDIFQFIFSCSHK